MEPEFSTTPSPWTDSGLHYEEISIKEICNRPYFGMCNCLSALCIRSAIGIIEMNNSNDAFFQCEFFGDLLFLPSSEDSSAFCRVEFTSWGPSMVACICLNDKHYEISNEWLLCPHGERRFRSRKNIAAYGDGRHVQLVLVKERLTPVTLGNAPHLRVVGDWIERTTDKNGRVSTRSCGFEGLLKQGCAASTKLDQRELRSLNELHNHWRHLGE